MRHGGRILVEQLRLQGADTVFCLPGESFLPVLDGLHDSPLRLIVGRQEGGVAMMAEAYGKLTGRPGIALVTRGPGATNASAGVHVARQDSTPMILFVGDVPRAHATREAFQEIDFPAMFAPIAKWAARVDDPARLAEFVARAYACALSGRPGPVVLSLPEDVLSAACAIADLPPVSVAWPAPSATDMQAVHDHLTRAARPLLLLGGSGWSRTVQDNITRFAAAYDLPVAASFRRQDYFDNAHDNYIGHAGVGMDPALAERIAGADVLLALGTRLGEIATGGYELLAVPQPTQRLLHVHPDPNELGRVYRTDLAVISTAARFAEAAAALPGIRPAPWRAWRQEARAAFVHFAEPRPQPGTLDLSAAFAGLANLLAEDAIITNGAGNYAAFLNRHHAYRRFGTQLAPTSGSMGYGLPAGIAAKLRYPERQVIAVAGDGCAQMTMAEFAVAVEHGLNLVLIVVNNGCYATIRMHQENRYPTRVVGTAMRSPDFAALARAYGGFGARVTTTEAVVPTLRAALDAGVPAIIEWLVDQQALSPGATLDDVRQRGLAAQNRALAAVSEA